MDESDRCMFCGGDETTGPMNREHFVPCCLWSGARPIHMRVVPAYVKCNGESALDAEYMRDVLVAEEGNNHPEAQLLRVGQLNRKIDKRFVVMERTFTNLRIGFGRPSSSTVFQPMPIFDLDRKRFDRAMSNVVRGCFHTINQRPVPQDCTISVVHDPDFRRPEYSFVLDNLGTVNDFGDDVFLVRTLNDSNGRDFFGCLTRFYGYREFLGIVLPPDHSRH